MRQSLILLASLMLVGCSAVKSPTATFKTMNVTDLTPQGFTMAFDLNVQNPNPVGLPLSQAKYKIGLGGVNVLEGKAKPAGTLPANGNLDLKLPVTITFENLLAAEKAIVSGGGKIPYALSGDLNVGGGDSAIPMLGQSASVPLKYEGTLDVKQLLQNPQVLMNSPAAKRLATQLMGSFFGR